MVQKNRQGPEPKGTHRQRPAGPARRDWSTLEQQPDPLSSIERILADPVSASPAEILALQRAVGNRAVTGLLQAKLTVGPVGDRYEQEADRVAEQVVSGHPAAARNRSAAQRQEEEELQAKPLIQRQEEEEIQAKPLVQRQEKEGEEKKESLFSKIWGDFWRKVSTREYVVQRGDTLAQIARQFGVAIESIKATNAPKLKTWTTSRGQIQGFNVGERILIPPAGMSAAGGRAEESTTGATGTVKGVIEALVGKLHGAANPEEVIIRHNQEGTFGEGKTIKVTSKKRDQGKQLNILRHYSKKNKDRLSKFAEETSWLKGTLDWEAFEKCGVSDEGIWTPFAMALYWGGGRNKTLPLVAPPATVEWKGRRLRASPHLTGTAMDVKSADLTLAELDHILKTQIPEFNEGGQFPIRSTQIESAEGQKCIHINFKKRVF